MTRVLELNVDDNGPGGVYTLVRSLIKARPEGYHFGIIAFEPFMDQANQDGLEALGCHVTYVGDYANKVKKRLVWYRNIRDLLRRDPYDYVHVHSDGAHRPLVAALAARMAGIDKSRIVVHSHASDSDGRYRWLKHALHLACRHLLPLVSSNFAACSDLAAQWMFPASVQPRVRLVHNGVDLQLFRFNPDDRQRLRRQLGIPDDSLLIGHVGRFSYQKNHPFLLRAFARTLQRRPDARLLLVGAGDQEKDTRQLANQLGIDRATIFFGKTDNVPQVLSALDLFALPSHFEGLPIVGVEAQASGLPLLLSDKITRQAALTSGASFLPIGERHLDDWANAMLQQPTRDRTADNDTLRQKHFDLTNAIDDFLAIYEQR